MLSACISSLPCRIEEGNAQRFAEEVIAHHSLVFPDDKQNAATRYVTEQVVIFSQRELESKQLDC